MCNDINKDKLYKVLCLGCLHTAFYANRNDFVSSDCSSSVDFINLDLKTKFFPSDCIICGSCNLIKGNIHFIDYGNERLIYITLFPIYPFEGILNSPVEQIYNKHKDYFYKINELEEIEND